MARLSLAGAQGLSLFAYTKQSDPPLILEASTPVASSAVVWHPNGSRFLTISTDGLQVSVWDKSGIKQLYNLKRTDSDSSLPVVTAVFHDGGVALASGSSVHLYSSTGAFVKSLSGHPLGANISCLSANLDDSLLASSAGSSLIIYNRTTNTQNTLHAKAVRAQTYSVLSFAPSRRTFLAAATSTGLVHLFDSSKPSAPLRTISLSSAPLPPAVTNLAFSTFAPLLLVSSATGHLSLVDTEKQKLVVQFELGVAVEKGKMALGTDGRTAAFVGKGVVRLLDIKTRKGCKEVKIEGGGRLGGIAFQPAPSKSRAAGPPSPTKPASSILTESINRMRASQRAASPTKEESAPKSKLLAAPQVLDGIDEVFSPLQFGGARTSQLDLAPQDLPSSKDAFAASIAREARTSTLRNPTLQQSHTPADRLAHSSSVSYASPDLPSYSHSPENVPPITRRSTSSSQTSSRPSSRQSASRPADTASLSGRSSLTSTRAASPALSVANTTSRSSRSSNETIGAVTRGLRLPELEDQGDVREERRRGKEGEREEGVELTPVPVKKGVKAGKEREREKEKRVGFAAPQPAAAPREAGPAPKRPEAPKAVAVGRNAVEPEDPMQEVAVEQRRGQGGGEDLLKAAVREVMEEFQSKTSRDVQNLHLGLIRGTFAQKTEMKALMKQYLGVELQQLREENARLREENARLKRGY
ncbi:WD40-repeat-containing domain protein [Leucosporidium creatinivorum]|uniref:WD40-repeat-containing domain protein n=1 Tax=Leucosporidium creatinivorum TaxID=106004 RepID=A0A1Y2FZR9_9BASI|nr:WD40-repeat-containing domain protein [Leucosporidium creatinivorum]